MLIPRAQAQAKMIGRIKHQETYTKPIPRFPYANDEATKTDIAVGMPDGSLRLSYGGFV